MDHTFLKPFGAFFLLLSGNAIAGAQFNIQAASAPVEYSYTRTPSGVTWTYPSDTGRLLGRGGNGSIVTIGEPQGTALGKTYGISSGSNPSIMSRTTQAIGKGAAYLKPTVAWPIIKSSTNIALLGLAKISPVLSAATLGVAAYQLWSDSGLAVSNGQVGTQASEITDTIHPWYFFKSGTKYSGYASPQDSCQAWFDLQYPDNTTNYVVATYINESQQSCALKRISDNANMGTLGSTGIDNTQTTCPTNYSLSNGQCVWSAGDRPITVISDQEALQTLDNTSVADESAVAKDVIEKGGTVELGNPTTSGPSSVSGPASTVTHPDGTKTVTNTVYNVTYNNNTVNVNETKTTQNQNPDGTPNGNPETEQKPPDEEQAKTDCEKDPGYLQCWQAGEDPGPVDLKTEEVDVAFEPEEMPGGAGSCPAPMNITLMGMAYALSWEPVCTYAEGIHFVVLSIAWLTAGGIVFAPVRAA